MLNHILIHFERFHDIAENIRKREGAIATCSDTMTTASFPQSYSINQRQSRSNLALVKLDCWHCHRQIYHLLPCISRARNGFEGQKRIRRAETDSKGRNVCAEAVRQHAGNRRWGSVWANDRLLDVWAGDLDFRVCRDFQRFTKESFQGFDGFCLLLCTVCMCIRMNWLQSQNPILEFTWNFAMFCFGWRSLIQDTHRHTHFFEQQGHITYPSLESHFLIPPWHQCVLSAMTYNARPFGIFKQERAWAWERVEHIHQYHQCCSFSLGSGDLFG